MFIEIVITIIFLYWTNPIKYTDIPRTSIFSPYESSRYSDKRDTKTRERDQRPDFMASFDRLYRSFSNALTSKPSTIYSNLSNLTKQWKSQYLKGKEGYDYELCSIVQIKSKPSSYDIGIGGLWIPYQGKAMSNEVNIIYLSSGILLLSLLYDIIVSLWAYLSMVWYGYIHQNQHQYQSMARLYALSRPRYLCVTVILLILYISLSIHVSETIQIFLKADFYINNPYSYNIYKFFKNWQRDWQIRSEDFEEELFVSLYTLLTLTLPAMVYYISRDAIRNSTHSAIDRGKVNYQVLWATVSSQLAFLTYISTLTNNFESFPWLGIVWEHRQLSLLLIPILLMWRNGAGLVGYAVGYALAYNLSNLNT